MLKVRIVPCLDIKNGRTVKGTKFIQLRDAGDPIELAKHYADQGADELVFLDISATIEQRETLAGLVYEIAREINIPFTVGGGIQSVSSAKRLLSAGADKISVNSSAVRSPELIRHLAQELGSQCVVVAIDTKRVDDHWYVFVDGGRTMTDLSTLEWVRQVEHLGAGEILLTAMNNDGTKDGFALDILTEIDRSVNIPVIGSGGAGCKHHFLDLFRSGISAGLAASVFHFNELSIPELKEYLFTNQIPIRN